MVQKRDNLALEIVALLCTTSLHARAIAQKLGAPHATTLRKLNALQQEHVLDARREGKNRVFFLKQNLNARTYILQAELHKLTQLLRREPSLGIILEEILQQTATPLIILFGSHAKGTAKEGSDIDIYLATTKRAEKRKIEMIHSQLHVTIGPFDTDNPLIKELIKNHIILRGVEVFHDIISAQAQTGKALGKRRAL